MICPNCNKNISDGFQCCPYCGTRVAPTDVTITSTVTTPAYGAPASNAYSAPVSAPSAQSAALASSALTFGILALAFACTWIVSFLGIVFGIMAKNKADNVLRMDGILTGKAKTGRILGKAGLIAGIIMSAIFVLYIILIFVIIFADMM